MITETLKNLYIRDLNKLKEELTLYSNEDHIWHIDHMISNSAGNLCLHLIGHLNTYIGAEFGSTGYIRNRPAEFSLKNIPRIQLISQLDRTIIMIAEVLGSMTEDQLESEYPQLVLSEKTSTSYFLIHLSMHLSYHLGQVNYHRRLLDH